ncbi:MAG: hypothetical protein OXG69_03640 [bacterium]|nr:hypothetical protein [bacterium]
MAESVASGLPPDLSTAAATLVAAAAMPQRTRRALIADPSATPEMLTAAAATLDLATLHAVAEHPRTPPETLWAVYLVAPPQTLGALAENPNTPYEALFYIAQDWSIDTRVMVPILRSLAGHPAANDEILELVACHPDSDDTVQEIVAASRSLVVATSE